MPDVDLEELGRNLATIATGLERHIAAEASKRAAELGKTYAKAADERIRDNAVELQRAQDLVAELRRQMKPLERQSDRYGEIVRLVRGASWDGRDAIDVKTLLDIINSSTEKPHAPDQQT